MFLRDHEHRYIYIMIWICWCRSKIKEEMKYCMEHKEEVSNLARVQQQVEEVKGIMLQNIDKVTILFEWIVIIL